MIAGKRRGSSGIDPVYSSPVFADIENSLAREHAFDMPLAFAVTCRSAANGSIRVTTITTGDDVDPDGYTAQLVGYAPYEFYLAVNGFYTYPSVQPGAYSVELKGVASNCTVSGTNPRSVTVTIGATADAVFAITCVRLQ